MNIVIIGYIFSLSIAASYFYLYRQFGGRKEEASRLFIELVCLEEVVADYAGR